MMNTSKSTDIVRILHENRQHAARNRSFFVWMPINLIVLSVILRDLWKPRRYYDFVLISEYFLAVILSLNILYLCGRRFLSQYFVTKYDISSQQFNRIKNLNIQIKDDSSLNVLTDQCVNKGEKKKKRISFEQFRVSMLSVFNSSNNSKSSFHDSFKTENYSAKSYHSSPVAFSSSPIVSEDSPDESLLHASAESYADFRKSYENYSNLSFTTSNLSKSYHSFLEEDGVDEVDSFRKSTNSSVYRHTPNASGALNASGEWMMLDSIFHRHQSVQHPDLVLNDVYHLSRVAASESVKPVSEVSSLGANSVVCIEFGVDPSFLPEWIANLRIWISQTILARIIKEIEIVNAALTVNGAVNVRIGSSGLERLKKVAASSHISVNIPSLPTLIPFLDVSTNQEYVVKRISALATGSMSNYCWNSGGTYEGKPWNDSLPTDAALVMHLVAAYFDSQLFPLPHLAPDGRQFSSAHFVQTPALPPRNGKSVIIYQERLNPPHFQLIVGDEVHDISRGRNNLFHVLLFFLQHIKTRESGMFEHVNLGSSGINMLWIINEPTNRDAYKKS